MRSKSVVQSVCLHILVPGVGVVDEHPVLHVEDLLDQQLEPLLSQGASKSKFHQMIIGRKTLAELESKCRNMRGKIGKYLSIFNLSVKNISRLHFRILNFSRKQILEILKI